MIKVINEKYFAIVGIKNDSSKQYYNDSSRKWVDDIKDATHYDDNMKARDVWFTLDKKGFKRVLIPVFDGETEAKKAIYKFGRGEGSPVYDTLTQKDGESDREFSRRADKKYYDDIHSKETKDDSRKVYMSIVDEKYHDGDDYKFKFSDVESGDFVSFSTKNMTDVPKVGDRFKVGPLAGICDDFDGEKVYMKVESVSVNEKIKGGSRINYDDDLVVVYRNGKEIYKGIEDYEPMNREPWKWDNQNKYYTLDGGYIKVCLEDDFMGGKTRKQYRGHQIRKMPDGSYSVYFRWDGEGPWEEDMSDIPTAEEAKAFIDSKLDEDYDDDWYEEDIDRVPGGRYWEPGFEDANEDEYIDKDTDNYPDEIPFDDWDNE